MKRRQHGEGTVYEELDPRRKSTHRAEVDVRLPTGVIYRVVARGVGPQEALRRLRQKVRRVQESHPEAEAQTVEQYLERWLGHKETTRRASTMRTYRQDVKHAVKHLGGIRLSRVTANDVQRTIDAIQSQGYYAQADRTRRTLKQAFKQAVRWQLLTRNPVDGVDPVERPEIERYYLTERQVMHLMSATGKLKARPLYALAIYSGLRVGELLALQWRHVGLDSVRVERTVSEGSATGYAPPKTTAGRRTVPVPVEVIRLLGKRGASSRLVFTTGSGKPLSSRNVARDLERAIAKTNNYVIEKNLLLPDEELLPPVTMHSFRRTFATLLAKAGQHPKIIQRLLGQSTDGLAMSVYVDVHRDQLEAARLDVGGIFGGSATAITVSGQHQAN